MSLFQAREWWSTKAGEGEEFDQGSMCVANIDNEPGGNNKIIVGSYAGILRMYNPKQREYRVEDLILEKNFGIPILQVAAGRFVSGSKEVVLALLHPHKLAVFMVSAVSSGGAVNYYTVVPAYEHHLVRPAYNMCYGPFGQNSGKDYICVQSLDGVLSFFEQDSFAFNRQLPSNFLIPGPLCYFAKTDTFLTCNSQMQIEAYRYSVLAAAQDNVDQDAAASVTSGKKVQVDWTTNIGEHARYIEVTRFGRSLTSHQEEILVIGEQTLFCLKEKGSIRTQKRIGEYVVTAALTYPVPPAPTDSAQFHNLLIGTQSGHLMVFRDVQLAWCARLQHAPVQIAVAGVAGVQGMITSLDDRGRIVISYLGTDPPSASLINTEMKELNYDEMETEHQQLLRVIRQTHGEGRQKPPEELHIKVDVPPVVEFGAEDEDCDENVGKVDGAIVQSSVRVQLQLAGAAFVENVTVTVDAPACFSYTVSKTHFNRIDQGQLASFGITFRVLTTLLCASLDVTMIVSYFHNDEPRCATALFSLPLALVARVVQPVKNAQYKIALDCSYVPQSLGSLFQDLLSQPMNQALGMQSSANILSIQYISGTDATIIVSKSAGRISVQSSEFAAMWLLSQELCQRLQDQAAGGESDEEPFYIQYQDSLPLHDYFALMDDHFALRKHIEEVRTDLGDRAQQYRAVQKRLLLRFKDRNPAPLNHLDVILTHTYEQIMHLADAIEDAQRGLQAVSCHLSAATELVLLLIRYRFDLDEQNFVILRRHLSSRIVDSADQGWEEQVDSALIHLLRTCLARNLRDRTTMPPPMKMPSDTMKLKKHITNVIDRLANGARLTQVQDADYAAAEGAEDAFSGGEDDDDEQ
mmetsp:Transcript_36785/g.88469  ORF Transcript_36785/g.88469 Transcript_36785/m.88469 type:complete len:861 (+) Transcript_36785:50-2632(+)